MQFVLDKATFPLGQGILVTQQQTHTITPMNSQVQATKLPITNLPTMPNTEFTSVSPMVLSTGTGSLEVGPQRTVMLTTDPGMPGTPVQISLPVHTPLPESDLLNDAAESLQALAGVVPLTDPSIDDTAVNSPSAEDILRQTQVSALDPTDEDNVDLFLDNVETNKSLQISSDQLMNLETGDVIEINGETYKVEFSINDPTTSL